MGLRGGGRAFAVLGEFVVVAQGVFVDNESWQVSEVGSRLKEKSYLTLPNEKMPKTRMVIRVGYPVSAKKVT